LSFLSKLRNLEYLYIDSAEISHETRERLLQALPGCAIEIR